MYSWPTVAELQTKSNNASVSAFLNAIEDDNKRRDAKAVAKLMRAATGERPKMWGTGLVGYGKYEYEYASGRSGEWFVVGFSPRKTNLTLYIMPGFSKSGALMKKLGKFKTGKSCLYINKLDDVDLGVLDKLIVGSVQHMKKKYKR